MAVWRSPRKAGGARLVRGTRLTTVIAVVVLVPFVMLAVAAVHLSSTAARDQAGQRVEAAAQASAFLVDAHLSNLANLVDTFARTPAVRNALEGSDIALAHVELEELRKSRLDILTVVLTDPNGIVLDVSPQSVGAIGEDRSSSDWFTGAVRAGESYVSTVHLDADVDGALVGSVAVPIPVPEASAGSISGVLVATFSAGALQWFTDEFGRTQNLDVTVVDQSGAVAGMPEADPKADPAAAAPEAIVSRRDDALVRRGLLGQSGSDEATIDGEQVIGAFAPVGHTGWGVTAELPASIALADTDRVRSAVVLVALLLGGVVIAGLIVLQHSLQRRARVEEELAQSEVTLRARESHLKLAIEAARLGTWEWTAGNDLSWSDELARMHGLDPDQPDRGTLLDTIYADDLDLVRSAFIEALSGGPDLHLEFRVHHGDGDELRWMETRTQTDRDEDGEPVRVVGITSDITDAKRSSEKLEKARDDADRANAAKSEFLARMSHELRTPLNAVLGFTQILSMDELNEAQAENVGFIASAGSHLLGLINDVLDVAAVESGRLSFSLEPVSVADVLCAALDIVRPEAARQDIALPPVPEEAAVFVRADRQRLLQIALNLLSNGVKYNVPGGRIDLTCQESGGTVSIAISDTGKGIDEAGLAKLFTPFERLGAEQTDVEGTGVGLALSRVLAQEMGGALAVSSVAGEGSTFTIELPAAQAPMLDAHDSTGSAPVAYTSTDRVTVLCIEDNLTNIRLFERIVEKLDVELLSATRGSVGIDLAREHQPDIVFLDLHLPDIPGEEVLRQLRDDDSTRDIPVVICSAVAASAHIENLLTRGADAYLTKPYELAELYRLIENAGRLRHELVT